MSGRGEVLNRIDTALAEVAGIDASLAAVRQGQRSGLGRVDMARRFHAIADASSEHHAFAFVTELAALAGRVADGADRSILHGEELDSLQHAADVLSLLLRDMGHQLLGRRGGDVTPAATALRDRLEQMLMATSH
jgi:hypothetical protein